MYNPPTLPSSHSHPAVAGDSRPNSSPRAKTRPGAQNARPLSSRMGPIKEKTRLNPPCTARPHSRRPAAYPAACWATGSPFPSSTSRCIVVESEGPGSQSVGSLADQSDGAKTGLPVVMWETPAEGMASSNWRAVCGGELRSSIWQCEAARLRGFVGSVGLAAGLGRLRKVTLE